MPTPVLTPPRAARIGCYVVLGVLLVASMASVITAVVPGKLGVFLQRNNEAYLALLVICAWFDGVRPRLPRGGTGYVWAGAAVPVLVVAAFALHAAPWKGTITTLYEGLIGSAIALPYLQQRQAARAWTGLMIAVPVLAPLVAFRSQFVTDMAEAFGIMVAVALVCGIVDTTLLAGGPVRRRRSLVAGAGVTLAMVLVHLVTKDDPVGFVENGLYYIRRANEGFVVAIVLFAYYATRRAHVAGPPDAAAGRAVAAPTRGVRSG